MEILIKLIIESKITLLSSFELPNFLSLNNIGTSVIEKLLNIIHK